MRGRPSSMTSIFLMVIPELIMTEERHSWVKPVTSNTDEHGHLSLSLHWPLQLFLLVYTFQCSIDITGSLGKNMHFIWNNGSYENFYACLISLFFFQNSKKKLKPFKLWMDNACKLFSCLKLLWDRNKNKCDRWQF